jgi:hypothetical protein
MKTERSAPRPLKPERRTVLLLAALAMAAQGSVYAGINDWTNVGPVDGAFSLLAIDPQNPGALVHAPIDLVSVLALDPQDPNTVYAGGPGGLFAINLAAVSGDGAG